MGSGVWPLAMATRPARTPRRASAPLVYERPRACERLARTGPRPHAAPATGRPKRVACSVSCRERGLPPVLPAPGFWCLALGATGVAPVASVELAFHRDAA